MRPRPRHPWGRSQGAGLAGARRAWRPPEVTHLPRVGSRGPGCLVRPLPVARLCPRVYRCGIPIRVRGLPSPKGQHGCSPPAGPSSHTRGPRFLWGKGVGQVNAMALGGGLGVRGVGGGRGALIHPEMLIRFS